MNWGAVLVTIPINALIFYCIYKDLSEAYEKRKRIDKRLDNLRSSDNIYINMTVQEKEMLDALTKFNGFKSNSEFIHSVIKQKENITRVSA